MHLPQSEASIVAKGVIGIWQVVLRKLVDLVNDFCSELYLRADVVNARHGLGL